MALDALVKPLLPIGLFRGLSPLQITEIARRAERIIYRPGETIIAEDTIGDAAVLIVSGDAVRVAGPEYKGVPESIAPGSLVGEMAMLVESMHSSTIMARGTVKALRLTRAEMLRQMEEDPSLAEHFVVCITGRLKSLADDLRLVDKALSRWSANAPLH